MSKSVLFLMRRGFCLILLLGLLSPGHAQTTPAAGQDPRAALPLRPAETPDVIIMSFAGFFTGAGPIGTGGPIQDGIRLLNDSFHMLGYTTKVQWTYAPSMGDSHISPFLLTQEHGLERAIRDMEAIKASSIDGFSNPTRMVLVSVSGGGAVLHLFPFLFPEVQFDYLIDLDTGCGGFTAEYISWWLTTPPWKRAYLRQHLHEVPRHVMPWIFGVPAPCAAGPRRPQTINNLVADNVIYNLDVRTALISSERITNNPLGFGPPVPLLFSAPIGISFNRRPGLPDGTPRRGEQAGIYRYVDTTSFHAGFDPVSDGGRWVAGKILELGLPPLQVTPLPSNRGSM